MWSSDAMLRHTLHCSHVAQIQVSEHPHPFFDFGPGPALSITMGRKGKSSKLAAGSSPASEIGGTEDRQLFETQVVGDTQLDLQAETQVQPQTQQRFSIDRPDLVAAETQALGQAQAHAGQGQEQNEEKAAEEDEAGAEDEAEACHPPNPQI